MLLFSTSCKTTVNQLTDRTKEKSVLNPKVTFNTDYILDGLPEHSGLPNTEPHTLTD